MFYEVAGWIALALMLAAAVALVYFGGGYD